MFSLLVICMLALDVQTTAASFLVAPFIASVNGAKQTSHKRTPKANAKAKAKAKATPGREMACIPQMEACVNDAVCATFLSKVGGMKGTLKETGKHLKKLRDDGACRFEWTQQS